MTATEKLFWTDPHAIAFDARVLEACEHGGKPSVVLARTLFYPEGGGQLGDTGALAFGDTRVAVVDTQIDDAGRIHHVLESALPEPVLASLRASEASARGTIDEARRRDHMAQHTAQHALSRALADVAQAETVSSRLGATSCTIDVAKASLTDAELAKAEDLVNALGASDVPVHVLYPSPEELATLPLRKAPKVAEGVRILDIEGFDMTPCGGTHCTRTGQFGQVRIVATEKYKGMLRLTFHAGRRALLDARARHEALAAAAEGLTCGALEVPQAAAKLRSELKSLRTRLDGTREELVGYVAERALAALPAEGEMPGALVLPIFRGDDDLAALRLLAGKLAQDARVVGIAAGTDPVGGELLVVVQRGRGPAATFDCGAFVQAQAKERAGRGGGRPERAEGRFPRGTPLEALAASARSALGGPGEAR